MKACGCAARVAAALAVSLSTMSWGSSAHAGQSLILAEPDYAQAAGIIAQAQTVRGWTTTVLLDDWSARSVSEIRNVITQNLGGLWGVAMGIGTWDRNWAWGDLTMEQYAVFPAAYQNGILGDEPSFLDIWPLHTYVNEDTFRVAVAGGRSAWCRLPVWTVDQALAYAQKDLQHAQMQFDPAHDYRIPWFEYDFAAAGNSREQVVELTDLLLQSPWVPQAPWEIVFRMASEDSGGVVEREQIVVDELNTGIQLAVFGLATDSHVWHLTRWTRWYNCWFFDLERLANQPAGYYPVLIVPSCDINRFDNWHAYWPEEYWDVPITSKLLLAPNAGVLAIVGPASNTTQYADYCAMDCLLQAMFHIGVNNIGEALRKTSTYAELFYRSDPDWSLIRQSIKKFVILGDATIGIRGVMLSTGVDDGKDSPGTEAGHMTLSRGAHMGEVVVSVPPGRTALLEVIDVSGRVVWTQAVRGGGSQQIVAVPKSAGGIASGIYTARLRATGDDRSESKNVRLVVVR
jgi:hypothetical protein